MTDLDRAQADETVDDATRLHRLAHVAATFREVPPGAYMIAYATEDGGVNGVTYGDIAAVVRINIDGRERLERIATWHVRESGARRCTECGHVWPCDTRRMADGTWTEEDGT
jgi:hypothetical protein